MHSVGGPTSSSGGTGAATAHLRRAPSATVFPPISSAARVVSSAGTSLRILGAPAAQPSLAIPAESAAAQTPPAAALSSSAPLLLDLVHRQHANTTVRSGGGPPSRWEGLLDSGAWDRQPSGRASGMRPPVLRRTTTANDSSPPRLPLSRRGVVSSSIEDLPLPGPAPSAEPGSHRAGAKKLVHGSSTLGTLRRAPRRRAVVVGTNYKRCGQIALNGAVNDAHLFALALVSLWGFRPENILLLTDEQPQGTPYASQYDNQKPMAEAEFARYLPERTHIVQGLRWLTSGAQADDSLVFFFAGHGLQLDNLSGWEGEGYDEALLPLDCAHESGDVNAMTAVALRQILLSVAESAQLSIFLDCAGGQTMLDAASTTGWTSSVKGVVQKGVWPLTDATDKVHRARYNPKVWTHPKMREKAVRPRFLPGVEVGNTIDLNDAFAGSSAPISGAKAFLMVGAPHSEVPIEGMMPAVHLKHVTPQDTVMKVDFVKGSTGTIHGAFTWALVQAMQKAVLESLAKHHDRRVTFKELESGVRKEMIGLKKKGFPVLEQVPSLTRYMVTGSSANDFIFYPRGGQGRQQKYLSTADTAALPTFNGDIPRRSDYADARRVQTVLDHYGLRALERNLGVKRLKLKISEMWQKSDVALQSHRPRHRTGSNMRRMAIQQ